jgi:ABC-type glucose/galactose transport system permease subunit
MTLLEGKLILHSAVTHLILQNQHEETHVLRGLKIEKNVIHIQEIMSFIISINNLPPITNSQSKPIFSTDNTSIIIYHPESDYLQNSINNLFATLNKWFKVNKLTLSFYKIHFMKFANVKRINLHVCYVNNN